MSFHKSSRQKRPSRRHPICTGGLTDNIRARLPNFKNVLTRCQRTEINQFTEALI